jgi:hypothetical protein
MVSELRDGVGQWQSERLEGDLCDRVDGEVRFDAGGTGRAPGVLTHLAGLGGRPAVLP